MQRYFGATYVIRNEAFLPSYVPCATKFVLLSFFSLIETICPRIGAQPQPKNGKNPRLTCVAQKRICFSIVDIVQSSLMTYFATVSLLFVRDRAANFPFDTYSEWRLVGLEQMVFLHQIMWGWVPRTF